MNMSEKEDLRVKKTKEAIRSSFESLLSEKDYDKITVKELCALARISKKTFYFHYQDLDELLKEWQSEISNDYRKRVENLTLPEDVYQIIREFFLFSEEKGPLYEKITCGGTFHYIRGQMIKNVCVDKISLFNQSLPGVYMNEALLSIYRYWIENKKSIPVEEIIKQAQELIVGGLSDYYKKSFR